MFSCRTWPAWTIWEEKSSSLNGSSRRKRTGCRRRSRHRPTSVRHSAGGGYRWLTGQCRHRMVVVEPGETVESGVDRRTGAIVGSVWNNGASTGDSRFKSEPGERRAPPGTRFKRIAELRERWRRGRRQSSVRPKDDIGWRTEFQWPLRRQFPRNRR